MADLGTAVKFAGWFSPFLNGVIFAVGVPGNILVLSVFSNTNRQPHLPIDMLVGGLIVADLLVCLCRMVILYLSLAGSSSVQDPASSVSVLSCRISDASWCFSIYIALLLLPAMAFDRYVATCELRKFKISLMKTKVIVATCFICATIFSSPMPFFGEFNIRNGQLCSFTSPQWLTALSFYSLLGLTVIAFFATATIYVAIYRIIRRRAKVENDRRNHSCLSLISVATRVSLNVQQIPSLGGPPPIPPPRASDDDSNMATTSNEPITCISDLRDNNPESETSNEGLQKLDQKRAKRKLRFDDPPAQRRFIDEIPISELLAHPPPPPLKTFNPKMSRMVFAKVLMFALTWIPLLAMMSVEHFAFTSLGSWLDVCLNLVLVNSALNMVIFAISSRQFRADFGRLVRGIRCFWEPRFERNKPIHLHHPYWIR